VFSCTHSVDNSACPVSYPVEGGLTQVLGGNKTRHCR
jgi:hypothetical protein